MAAGGPGGPAAGTIGDIVGQRLLTMLEAQEEKLDNELHDLERMDEDELERIRRQRYDQMKKLASQKQEWAARGHGEYRDIVDQKRFFEELKGSPRAVVHFYRSSNRRCEIVDKHLHILARKHFETKFVRIDAEKSPFVCEKLHIWMLPSIVCIRDGKTDHTLQGFDELGGNDNFQTEQLEALLLRYGALLESFCG